MLFSVPRVIAVMVFALVTCVMAAPTAVYAPKSVDDRVQELAVKVNEWVLAESKEVGEQLVRCRDATLERSRVALGALYAHLTCGALASHLWPRSHRVVHLVGSSQCAAAMRRSSAPVWHVARCMRM